ncbi:MAG: leucine-rich repeat domain-containing protein [Lachnospiraceae bacterium]|nr:leucine-rich repeat domain-containing protein [Lachnospiraceae bacterium]
MYMYKFCVYDTFFNAKGATFEADFGEYDFCLDQNMWTVNENKNEVGNLSLVPMRNNGTMIFSELCYCEFGDGSQGGSVYQHDRCAQMPFINNGIINVKNKYNNTEVNRTGTLEIRYSSFINNGSLNIDNYKGQLYEDSIGASYSGLYIYKAELVNTGTINVNNYAGKGISLEGLYYDPSQCSNEYKSVTEKQKCRIINKSGGNININTAKNSIGLLIGDYNLLDNSGTITLNFIKPTETNRNNSFVIQQGYYEDRMAEVNNTGIIVNNGFIAKTNKDKELNWKGNKWTGTGKEGMYVKEESQGGGDDPSEDPSDDPLDNPGGNGGESGGSTTQTPTTQAPTSTPASQTPVAEGGSIDSTNSSDKFSTYTVTSSDATNPEVAYTGTTDKKARKVTVPSTVTSNGVTYTVTSIEDNAFKGNTKLKSVTISANVEEIGNNAFSGCSSLKSVTLPAKVSKIGNNAFKGCKKLKTLTIKSTKLTSKTISKSAFKGITNKTTIKVPKKMKKTYTKLFRKKGLSKKVKIKS